MSFSGKGSDSTTLSKRERAASSTVSTGLQRSVNSLLHRALSACTTHFYAATLIINSPKISRRLPCALFRFVKQRSGVHPQVGGFDSHLCRYFGGLASVRPDSKARRMEHKGVEA